MIEKWVNFKRDYLEISFLRENCGYDGSDERRRFINRFIELNFKETSANATLLLCGVLHNRDTILAC